MVTTAPPPLASALIARSGAAAKANLPGGLTSDEARRRLEKFGPNAMPDTALHPLRMALEKFWAPVPWMLEAAIVLEMVLGKYRRGGDHRRSAGVQRRARAVSGEPRPGDACRAEVAARAERVGPARRRVEDHARGRAGAGRRGEAVARRRGRRGCAPHRRRNPARPIHAHRRIGARSKPARACRPMPGRWCGAARRWRRSRRPARAPSSAAPRSWSAPPMS